MGWFWERSAPASNGDPLRDLDPSLRDFLDKESPVKYKPAAPSTPPTSTTTSATELNASPLPSSTPIVPKQSLYQDGRYAHLWKDYRPQVEIEAEAKSEQEKLSDVLEGYKERKVQIATAAVENCSFEQEAIDNCFDHGPYMDRLLMCRPENRAFERCYVMQSRFLKALGFMSTYERPPEVDEEIQMHADTLYHRMLAQEKAIESAKAAGQPIPTFPPILGSRKDGQQPQSFRTATISATSATTTSSPVQQQQQPPQTPAEANRAAVARAQAKKDLPPLDPEIERKLKPEAALQLRKRLKGLDPLEREVEQRSTLTEIEDAMKTGQQIHNLRDEARQRRKAAGEGRGEWGDFLVKWFGGPGQK